MVDRVLEPFARLLPVAGEIGGRRRRAAAAATAVLLLSLAVHLAYTVLDVGAGSALVDTIVNRWGQQVVMGAAVVPGWPPAGSSYALTTRTSSVRGPWTPSTRSSSMSDVAEGPETSVTGRPSAAASASAATASGTPATIRSASTTHTW